MGNPLYKPRPERWQFSLRGLFIVTTLAAILAATVLPKLLAAYLEWEGQTVVHSRLVILGNGSDGPGWFEFSGLIECEGDPPLPSELYRGKLTHHSNFLDVD